jgi:TolB-like protein
MKQSLPVPPSGSREALSEFHLDSWKEIAAYVKRDVSTAQRWEKREGMPVHRHLHDKQGSVYALTAELDAWLRSRSLSAKSEEKEPVEAPTEAVGHQRRSYARHRRWLIFAAVTAIAVIGVAYFLTQSRTVVATGPKIKSLVVLPLRNFSGDSEQQYFVDGLTDELTTDLAKLGNLRVIARSSAMVYANTRKPLPQIAKDLNVDAVLTGTVERSGNRVRVRTELVRPVTDEVLWAESYDRDLDDALRMEGEVSQAIAREVGIKLTPQAQRRLQHKATTSAEAHDAFLQARYFLDKDTKEGALNCMQNLQNAIAADPNYAAAYSLLTRCYDLAYYFDVFSADERDLKVRAAALKAVELDEGLSEGHAALGDDYYWKEWNFGAAEREYKRAIELDLNSSIAHENYSFFLQRMGRPQQALGEIYQARELDPLSRHVADTLAWTLLYTRQYDLAVDQFRRVLEMDPNYWRSIWGLARTYELKGMYTDAISECMKIILVPNIDPFAKALFQRRCSLYEKVYSGGRINRKWYESAHQEIKDGIGRDDDAYSVATLYAASAEEEKALDLLERAYIRHDSKLLELKVDPRLDNLRPSPRFQALLRRMNFPD